MSERQKVVIAGGDLPAATFAPTDFNFDRETAGVQDERVHPALQRAQWYVS